MRFLGRPFVKRFALYYQTVVCPVCGVGVLWPHGSMDQDETWHGGRPRPRPHCARWDLAPLPKTDTAPNFRPVSIVDNGRSYQLLLSSCISVHDQRCVLGPKVQSAILLFVCEPIVRVIYLSSKHTARVWPKYRPHTRPKE